MRNVRLTLGYDGARFRGWQVQRASDRTVQGILEDIIGRLTQAPCRLRAAGRTDAGVHAQGQVASFQTKSTLRCKQLLTGLNALCPNDIVVHAVDDVPLTWDPRRSNAGKHYRYTIANVRRVPLALRGRCYGLRYPLDIQAMSQAARYLVGHHDFAAFRASDCVRETTVRTIHRCTVSRAPCNPGQLISIDVEGTAFLKNMVRIIAGTLADVGRGRMPANMVKTLISNGDRREAGITAPAEGLCLVQVFTTSTAWNHPAP